jgi:isoquinoline 1-oxidoreductase beta subunit
MDELAHAAKQDPVAYRKTLLGHNPRALAVLTLAAEKAGWGQPLPAGHGRRVSVQQAFGSYVSQVAEVEVATDGSVKVHRIVCAVDCGMVVNPDTIEAQVQGGTFFGLTAALYGAITLKNGRVEQAISTPIGRCGSTRRRWSKHIWSKAPRPPASARPRPPSLLRR